uniref:Uncharacterized protein n=1 Tax=Craspedostauros australis TaxID=1486917 RepID=A0A7R9ZT48_9STRA
MRLHRDGSFELLQEPEPQESPTSAKGMGNGGTNDSDADLAQKSGIPVIDKRKVAAGHGNASKTTGQLGAEEHAPTRYGTLRIWTSYDEMEKKHWLTVRNVESEEDDHAAAGPHSKPPNGEGEQSKPSLYRRFLLQDNLLPAWHGSTRRISLPSRIHESVEQMVETILRAK